MGQLGYALNHEAPAFVGPPGALYNYVLASDGLYLQADREGLSVRFRIAAAGVRGLRPLAQAFEMRLPRVPVGVMDRLWERANVWAMENKECLWHLAHWETAPWDDGWILVEPEQERGVEACTPIDSGESYARAFLEVHSHHSMPAVFSETDDADETGFRIFAVLGRLGVAPEIRVRVGVYGYFWEVPASWVMDLPAGLRDCNEEVFIG